ncbi:MAG: hypothetical protein ACREHD_33725, partial [Pirellulales bacterium]
CHRPVPDTATKCPHQGCGHAFPGAHTGVKRPPPPPTRVHGAGNDAHPATPGPIGPQGAVGARSSRGRLLVWLFAMLVGSAAVSAGLLAYLPWSQKKEAAPVEVATEPLRPTSKTAAKAAAPPSRQTSDKTAPPQQPGKVSPKEGDAASTEPALKGETSPTKPDKSLGIVADKQKGMVADEPTGLLADAHPKPEPLAVPEEPKLAIVADTTKGLYAERTKPKTPELLAERGGTVESQKAVEDGLNWLARHQGQDGHWGADCLGTDPNSRCDQKAPCQETGQAYEIAQTGLALLAFQAAGHYYFNGQKYSSHVQKGLDYFVQEQAPDGSIVGSQNPSAEQIKAGASFQQHFMYEHAMGTFALCEACAVAIAEGKKPDPRYLTAAQRAAAFIEKVQHADGGWRYRVDVREQSDCSVSGWVMLALKTAREAKLNVSPLTISRMLDFFAAHYADGQTEYGAPPNLPTDAMTGVGMMAVEFFQHKLDSPIVQGGAAYLAEKSDVLTQPLPGFAGAQMQKAFQGGIAALPASFDPSINYYLWYNCTMAMFQVGGEPWKRWNGAVRDRVIGLQVQGEGCDRGSWPANDFYGGSGGRIYSTALAVLTLEVYYRFQRVAGQSDMEQFFGK